LFSNFLIILFFTPADAVLSFLRTTSDPMRLLEIVKPKAYAGVEIRNQPKIDSVFVEK
jgi:hypothetical protein